MSQKSKGFKSANSTCLKFYSKNSSYTITFTNARFILNQSFNSNLKRRIQRQQYCAHKIVDCPSFSFLKWKSCQYSYRGRPELAYKITNSNDKIDQLYSLRHLRNGLSKMQKYLFTENTDFVFLVYPDLLFATAE